MEDKYRYRFEAAAQVLRQLQASSQERIRSEGEFLAQSTTLMSGLSSELQQVADARRLAEIRASQECAGCKALESKVKKLKEQLEVALKYRSKCHSQGEEISTLKKLAQALRDHNKDAVSRLNEECCKISLGGVDIAKVAGAVQDAESARIRNAELEVRCKELQKQKEVLKRAYKDQRQRNKELLGVLPQGGGQKVLSEHNASAPGTSVSEPASGCLSERTEDVAGDTVENGAMPEERPSGVNRKAMAHHQVHGPATAGSAAHDVSTTVTDVVTEADHTAAESASAGEDVAGPARAREKRQPAEAEEPPSAVTEVGKLTAALKLRPEPVDTGRSPNNTAGADVKVAQLDGLSTAKATVAKKAPNVLPEGTRGDGSVTPHVNVAHVKRSKRKTAGEVEGSPLKLSNGAKRPIATRQRVGTRLAIDTTKAVGRAAGRARGKGAGVSMSPGASPREEDGSTKPSTRVAPGMTTPMSHIGARSDKQTAPATDPPWKSKANDSRIAKGSGVLETLQILDFQQGLVPSSAAQPKRFPAIVDYSTERKTMEAAGPSKTFRKNSEPTYKYQEVVRKKSERELLEAVVCPDCKGFYAAVRSWNGQVECDLPQCGHTNGAADEMEHMQQDVSRHRYKHKPPGTPEGFWDMGFPGDSQDCRT